MNTDPADFGNAHNRRQSYQTHPNNTYNADFPDQTNHITTLWVGGNLNQVKNQRLTTVQTP